MDDLFHAQNLVLDPSDNVQWPRIAGSRSSLDRAFAVKPAPSARRDAASELDRSAWSCKLLTAPLKRPEEMLLERSKTFLRTMSDRSSASFLISY
jgi:hypothetical protein